MVVDEGSRKLIDNAVKEDDILNENVTSKGSLAVFKAQTEHFKISNRLNTRGPSTETWMRFIYYRLCPISWIASWQISSAGATGDLF